MVLYGLEATGKSSITNALLEALSSNPAPTPPNGDLGEEPKEDILQFAIVKSTECITGRHLLEQTVGAVAKAVEWTRAVGRCESLAQFVVELGRLLKSRAPGTTVDMRWKFVLVFDGIDNQREAPPTLIPALARLGEIVSGYTTNGCPMLMKLDPKSHHCIHSDFPASQLLTFPRCAAHSFSSLHEA